MNLQEPVLPNIVIYYTHTYWLWSCG